MKFNFKIPSPFKRFVSIEFILILLLLLIGFLMHIYGLSDSLDAKFYYTQNEAQLLLEKLSASEVHAYIKNELLDLLFLSTYSTLFFLISRRVNANKSVLQYAALVPGFFDLIETGTILLLLSGGLSQVPQWLGYVTCVKWSSGAIIVGQMVHSHFRAGSRKIRLRVL